MTQVHSEPVSFNCDGHLLRGTLSRVEAPRLLVLINGATGVPASFYLPFARWLAEEKHAAVLTWDYRDFGASGSPYRSDTTMTEWVTRDPVAARAWLRAQVPDVPLWVIGHSLGGMALAFQPDTDTIDRIITVASGHGHITDHPWPFQARVWALWYLLGPVATWLLGYFPARRFGLGNDLPKGVFWQWRRWLLARGALPADRRLGGLRDPGYRGPITLVAMEDDVMIPPRCVWKMAGWHPNAQIERRLLVPADHGLAAIGHVHPFSARNSAVWPSLIA
ncbi:MAG: alpha/beta fold hydrolase [Pararhodobacter sp.]